MAKIEPNLLNLAGEYRVCSELAKRGVFATVTYGNRKGVDLYAISDGQERALKIEVKTTQRGCPGPRSDVGGHRLQKLDWHLRPL